MRDEQLHAVVARSTFRISKTERMKRSMLGALLEVEMSKKCTQCFRNTRVRTTFGRSDIVSRSRRKGLRTLSKVRKA